MKGLRRDKARTAVTSGPHPFVPPDDSRLGLAMAASQPELQMGPGLAVANASLRGGRCAMAGCGRGRDDAIHHIGD